MKRHIINDMVTKAINRDHKINLIENRPINKTMSIEIYKLQDMELIYRICSQSRKWLLLYENNFFVLNTEVSRALSWQRRKLIKSTLS